jgi:hypothetical protein
VALPWVDEVVRAIVTCGWIFGSVQILFVVALLSVSVQLAEKQSALVSQMQAPTETSYPAAIAPSGGVVRGGFVLQSLLCRGAARNGLLVGVMKKFNCSTVKSGGVIAVQADPTGIPQADVAGDNTSMVDPFFL